MPTSVMDLALLMVYGFLFGLGFHWADLLIQKLRR